MTCEGELLCLHQFIHQHCSILQLPEFCIRSLRGMQAVNWVLQKWGLPPVYSCTPGEGADRSSAIIYRTSFACKANIPVIYFTVHDCTWMYKTGVVSLVFSERWLVRWLFPGAQGVLSTFGRGWRNIVMKS